MITVTGRRSGVRPLNVALAAPLLLLSSAALTRSLLGSSSSIHQSCLPFAIYSYVERSPTDTGTAVRGQTRSTSWGPALAPAELATPIRTSVVISLDFQTLNATARKHLKHYPVQPFSDIVDSARVTRRRHRRRGTQIIHGNNVR